MTNPTIPFEIVALEWFLEKHLRVCLESPTAMEERLVHDGWPENMVLYARAVMAEMAGKAGRGERWQPARDRATEQKVQNAEDSESGNSEPA